jgi:Tfp pilus assembly protein PilZ
MKDNRRYKRHKIDDFEIHGKIAFANETIVNNLGMGGASITTDRRLNLGEEYLLSLRQQEIDIRIRGIVVWSFLSTSRPDQKGNIIPIYSVGLKFTKDSDDKIRELIALLEEHEQKLDRTVNGRIDEFVNLSEQSREALDIFAD